MASKRNTVRWAAVVTIQSAARGFLARKDMRTVRMVDAEAEEIARRIETTAIHPDAKVGEMLMALLLRLDSVRGAREFRKKVTCRVIQLQESLDSRELRVVQVESNGEKGGEGASVVTERMMAEGEQVKGLLKELCGRSAEQGQLMLRLVQSVDQLKLAVQRMEQKGKLQANHDM